MTAPIAPGMVRDVPIKQWRVIKPGEKVPIRASRGTIALDGEREVELLDGMKAAVCVDIDGPFVVNFDAALAAACSVS